MASVLIYWVCVGASGDAATVRVEADQSADQVPRPTVAEEQHEDDECHLPEGAPQTTRRLGIRKWYVTHRS